MYDLSIPVSLVFTSNTYLLNYQVVNENYNKKEIKLLGKSFNEILLVVFFCLCFFYENNNR